MTQLAITQDELAKGFVNNSVELANKNSYGFIETECEFVKYMIMGIVHSANNFSYIFDHDREQSFNNLINELYYG